MRRLSQILARELEVVQLGSQIQSQVQSEVDKGQREFFLRQQLKAIQDELGEGDEQQAEANELRQRVEEAELPEHALKAAERELSRLEKLPPAAAEHGVIRSYLEWLVELPWSKWTEDNLDIAHAREVLDADHYDLEKVKDRILEYLAVRKLKPDSPGPILCFVGPPGVGKTSLGRSIAKALGREFERISVGGVRDEAEIRGHRRTYIGALPGTIVRALRDAGSRNPVFMIDEIDKMGADFRGDPSSAMLEVLDPAQNDSFRDHYLDLEFDLSEVLFIATANVLDTVPGPLQDRMETIELAGYTLEEKRHIARRYLVPRQIEANGLKPSQIEFAEPALTAIVEEYTREAGVRNLERQIGTICRKVARDVAEGKGKGKVRVSAKRARELLGRRRVFAEQRRRTKDPGVATGLAWTPAGGDVLFIEATAMPGSGKLTITGQLGDVMKESAQAALSYVRGHWRDIAADLDAELVRRARHPHPRSGRRGAQGRALGGRGDDGGAGLADLRPAGAQRCRDDRRGDPDRPGAADRRPQGEVAGGPAGRDQAGDRAEAQRRGRRRDPRARAQRAGVRLRRRGLEGDRRRPQITTMEAAEALGRGNLSTFYEAIREGVRARSRAFWIVAGLTVVAAALRFATLGVQAYHHDEIVTASRVLRDGFWHAMEAVGFSESAPPLYYALAWVWTQLTGTGEVGLRSVSALAGVATVPVAYLLGAELRGRRAGIVAAALVAVNPMLLWYSQEARELRPARLADGARGPLLRPRPPIPRGRRDLTLWGVFSALALATHYFAIFPIALEAAWLLWRRRRQAVAGLWIVLLAGLALAPLAIHQMSLGHAEWIGDRSLGHRVWEAGVTFVVGETGDIVSRPETVLPAVVPLLAVLAGLLLLALRGERGERRAAGLMLAVAAVTVAGPLALALVAPGKDYVLARNLLPALVPLLVAVAIGVTLRRARRIGTVVASVLVAYSLGFCVWVSALAGLAAARLGLRRGPPGRADGAAGDRPLDAWERRRCATTSRPAPSRRSPPKASPGACTKSTSSPTARRRRFPPRLLGPRFRQVGYEQVGRLYVRRYALPGPDLAHLRLRRIRSADLNFRSNGVLLDGIGPR